MYGQKANKSIRLIISLIFIFVGLVANFPIIIEYGIGVAYIAAVMIALYCFIIYYALWGYKIPHGNLLRYEFIAYAIMNAFVLLVDSTLATVSLCILVAKALLSIYMAGRLDKIKKNIWIMIAVLVLEILYACSCLISGSLSFLIVLTAFNGTYMWVALCGAYITRYKLHKEAGLTDKK